MALKEHINNIRDNLEKGLFTTEAAVSDGIVLRLLAALGWTTYDPQVLRREYSVEGGKVDIALFHSPLNPRVFIEVKQVGNLQGAEEQLFRYAFRRGVPIAILTDGQEWRFFYPTGEGTPEERKVHELNLIEDDSEETANYFKRYLRYESIRNGEAVKAIKDDYENVLQQRQIETHLPDVWSELVQEKNEYLMLAMMEKVKHKVGYEPMEEQVLGFLKRLKIETESLQKVSSFLSIQENPVTSVSTAVETTRMLSRKQKAKAPPHRFIVVMPNNETVERPTSQDTFVEVLLKLIEMLGEEQVLRADEEEACISTTPLRPAVRPRSYGKYSISTNHGVPAKVRLLERITARLNVKLKIES